VRVTRVTRLLGAGAACLATLGSVATADAAWSALVQGQGEAVALTMPAGQKPTARPSGSSVTVVWNASTFASGPAVEGYTVQRYHAGVPGSVPVNANCSGTVFATSCTENGVPSGTWTYTVIPIQGGWHGAESPQSAPVSV
jgi:hypothetical protein